MIQEQGHKYHVRAGNLRVAWDEKRFAWAVQCGGRIWESAEPDADAVKVRASESRGIAMQSASRLIRSLRSENSMPGLDLFACFRHDTANESAFLASPAELCV